MLSEYDLDSQSVSLKSQPRCHRSIVLPDKHYEVQTFHPPSLSRSLYGSDTPHKSLDFLSLLLVPQRSDFTWKMHLPRSCSACITGLPHHCNSFACCLHAQRNQVPATSRGRLDCTRDDRSTGSPDSRSLAPPFYAPPTPRTLPGLPWAPLSRRGRSNIQRNQLFDPSRINNDRNAASHVGNGTRSRSPGAKDPTPNSWIPNATYHFESEWREDAKKVHNHSTASERQRMTLPKLETQFSGRDDGGYVPCNDGTQHYDMLDGNFHLVRQSVFRKELSSVAGSVYARGDEGSRIMGQGY